ncbi:hypothetical protein BH09ACT1_BH09ACT1_20910 [soil metagenome]
MIWKFSYLPGIVIIGAVGLLLNWTFWQSVLISAIVYALITGADFLIERYECSKSRARAGSPPSPDVRGRPASGTEIIPLADRQEPNGPPRFPDPGP